MNTQLSFKDRINDEAKVKLAGAFIFAIKNIAFNNNKTEDEVYTLWDNYTKMNYDQSCSLNEFKEWNKLV